jgi:hypothetical protein
MDLHKTCGFEIRQMEKHPGFLYSCAKGYKGRSGGVSALRVKSYE